MLPYLKIVTAFLESPASNAFTIFGVGRLKLLPSAKQVLNIQKVQQTYSPY
jgi:hypothetical protein